MQAKIHYLKEHHTVLLCIGLSVASLGVSALIKFIVFHFQDQYAANFVREMLFAIFCVLIAYIFNGKNFLRQRHDGFFQGLLVAAFPLTLSALAILSGILNAQGSMLSINRILIFLLYVTSIGIAEEFLFRGCIVNILASKFLKNEKGVYLTVFISGAIFGAMHLANLFSGVAPLGAVVQAICAVPIGCLYAAIYLRTKNIWLLVFIHALNDFACLISAGLYGVGTIENVISTYSPLSLISLLVYLVPLIYLLRKSKMEAIIAKNVIA